ncbi:MAG TPA: hypothetical protein VEK08_06110 [Planctomycetota bacterium]|nr:hypothetical protein [Planctomycetota bacterium]
MKEGRVHAALQKISDRLNQLNVPYAIVGGMALVAHGYFRTTEDVDILVTRESHATIKEKLEGLGYVAPFAGSKNLKDVENNTPIEFLITGGFPGDGKPKPVSFPDPATCAIDIDGKKYIELSKLMELKLASGMSNVLRSKDLGDATDLIRILKLDAAFAEKLNPYVREKYMELWKALQAAGNEPT